jgi:glycosyltransferase involved in cell wall biosynthesis
MKQVKPFPERARFLWAFVLNRWTLNRQRTRVLPADYVPIVSVVIPALNEAENLPYVLPLIPHWIDEVILVDGHSHDGTVEVACKLLPEIHVVQQSGRGKGNALRAGFTAATGDIIVMLDADCSTDPGEIPVFISALLTGADFAKGSRFAQGGGTADMPLYRKFGNMCFVLLVRLLFGGSYSDLCYGYNAFWADVLPALNLDSNGFEIETLMNVRALQAKLKIVEVPSFEDKRRYGSSRLRTIPDGWRVLKTIFQEWLGSQRPATKVLPPKTAPALPVTSASDTMALSSMVEAEVP